ncbi:flavin monoamine oxidase family protein [Hydrogenophaga flava]|uniref:flavin monoamine oxidase family protein n=1 Tax=Hydrogenophaga flava TaxID=65657 RepID=UPI0008270218|nr:FAD-dependent oxidoreductase [Hydrogenophaga flava]
MAEVHVLRPATVWDVVIVGAGLCGLALAHRLTARGQRVCLLEARERIGGRVLTQTCATTGQPLDLGPSWFWPETEPHMVALLRSLGLESVPQHDPGDALWLVDPNRQPERRMEAGGVHAGAHRIAGGSASLVEVLLAALPGGSVLTGSALIGLRDHGESVELLRSGGPALRARRVVLALPPRLVQERIAFDPPLSAALDEALKDTPTWMAAQAKALVSFATPFWRAAGHSGNAFVRHPQAVLGEVFDQSRGPAGALGGFVALDASQREHFRVGLPLLVESQLAQLYGIEAQAGQLMLQDWAQERWTCSDADRAEPPAWPQADPLLRRCHWGGRLWFGGTETATHGAGHMEGALASADRLAHALLAPATAVAQTSDPTSAVAEFSSGVQRLRALAGGRYRQQLVRLLSAQQNEQLTQRALLAAADQTYSEALAQLDAFAPWAGSAHTKQGRHSLTPALLKAFDGWNKALLDDALAHNATSCALSNFPQDHRPDTELLRTITRDLAAAWREFALELNARLVAAPAERERA